MKTVGFNPAPAARPWYGYLGANQDGWFDPPRGIDTMLRDLRLMREAGSTIVRVEFPWHLIEPAKGDFRWDRVDDIVAAVKTAGLQLHVQVFYTPEWAALRGHSQPGPSGIWTDGLHTGSMPRPGTFAPFITALLEHIQSTSPGGLSYLEIGNEYDGNPGYFSSANTLQEYVDNELRPGYEAAKAVDESIGVLVAGLAKSASTDFLSGVLEAGGRGYFDIFSMHTYGTGLSAIEHIEHQRAFLDSAGLQDTPLWVTEFGEQEDDPHSPVQRGSITAVLGSSAVDAAEFYEICDDDVYGAYNSIVKREPYGVADHDGNHTKSSYKLWQQLVGGGATRDVQTPEQANDSLDMEFTGGWSTFTELDGRYQGSSLRAAGTDSSIRLAFVGHRVRLFANTSQEGAHVTVTIDGVHSFAIDGSSRLLRTGRDVFDSGLLPHGEHTIVVALEVAGQSGKHFDFDRFTIYSDN